MNCKVCGNTSSKNPEVSFFRFPSERGRRRDWAERCNVLDLYEKSSTQQFYKSYRICSDHFDPKYIRFDGKKKRLFHSAVPEIFHKKPQKIKPDDKDDQNDYEAEFKLKLVKNLCRLCGEENRNLTEIFGWRGKKLDLENKLKHLPLVISEHDVLPVRLCQQCIFKINDFHEFIINCIKSENKLKIMLDLEGCDTTYKKIEDSVVENETKDLPESEQLFPEAINYDMFFEEIQLNDLSSQDIIINNNSVDSLNNQVENHENSEKNSNFNFTLGKLNIIKEVDFTGHLSLEHDYSNMLLKQDGNNLNELIIDNPVEKSNLLRNTCYECLKSFSTVEILNAHVKAHLLKPDANGQFVCKSCNKVFRNRYKLNEHNRIHTGENPYKCDVCSKSFHKVALLKQHLLIHNQDKPFSCSICNVRSSRKGNLIQHMKSHYKVGKVQNLKKKSTTHVCKVCSYIFPNSEDLKAHEQISHVEENLNQPIENKFTCVLCRQNFSTAEECQNHLKDHPFEFFICSICRKQFSSIDSIKHHFKSHNSDTKYTCRYCDKNFKSKEICVTHERMHTGEAPFECPDCGKAFRSRQSFHQHKTIHSDKRLFSCEECGMSFKRKDTLKNHFRIHTGERPYACTICGFAFKQKGDCIKHEKNHKKKKDESDNKDDIPEPECNLYNESFEESEDLKRHLVTVHDQDEGSAWTDSDNLITLQSYSNIVEENLSVENLSEGQAILALAL